MSQVNIPVVNAGYLNVQGLQLAWASNTTLTMQAGQARDSSNVNDIILSAPVTINAAAHQVINGIDTGVLVASSLYAVYAVGDSSQNNPSGALLSLNLSAPLLPFGYDMYRLIGYMATDASVHFLLGYWSGSSNERTFTFDAPQATAVTAGAATAYTAVALTKWVPPVANTLVSMFSSYVPATAGNTLKMQGLNSTGDAVTITGQVATVAVTSLSKVLAQLTVGLLPEINYKVANAGDSVALDVAGYQYSI